MARPLGKAGWLAAMQRRDGGGGAHRGLLLAALCTFSGSFCRPSLGPTSTMVTLSGSALPRNDCRQGKWGRLRRWLVSGSG